MTGRFYKASAASADFSVTPTEVSMLYCNRCKRIVHERDKVDNLVMRMQAAWTAS
jgi:hypothetical protein